jgi:hypothetical protein
MSFHRVVFVALATLFTIGMTSMASAGCCDGGYSAPVTYAQVAPVTYGYGGYGGCGGCGAPTAAVVYAQPVVPAPIAVNTCCGGSAWGGTSYWGGGNSGCCGNGWTSNWNTCGNCGSVSWSVGCGSCGAASYSGCGNCGGGSPLYVVNQGPVYSGLTPLTHLIRLTRPQPTIPTFRDMATDRRRSPRRITVTSTIIRTTLIGRRCMRIRITTARCLITAIGITRLACAANRASVQRSDLRRPARCGPSFSKRDPKKCVAVFR